MAVQCEVVTDFVVFQGTDGVFGVFLLKNNRAIEDLSFITRVVLENNDESVDTDSAPAGTITWTSQGEYFDQTANILNFKLGNLSLLDGIKSGYRITVYDAVNANGIVYADNLTINFIAPES